MRRSGAWLAKDEMLSSQDNPESGIDLDALARKYVE